ncbi:DUF2471 family protein [Paraburkholderia sp. SARCC-3016]|uniref:DUF2471 family protein n=1 Tax=Paraburkholderia sp. SARCC-3016 TaxID=3058611 RepID=UPI0028066FDD|nr:DUF2471 family protein [Paraburkholderia sp. SARCC-3016]MDQ7979866.1 DUF2471 family protein [Paraburkholderia sp. SARCC-3016]
MDVLYAADAALKDAVPSAVQRHRAAGTLTWALIHQIESEVFAEVSSTGKHSAQMLRMLRASPAMGYPQDDRPVSFEGHDVIPSVFGAIYAEWIAQTDKVKQEKEQEIGKDSN